MSAILKKAAILKIWFTKILVFMIINNAFTDFSNVYTTFGTTINFEWCFH